MGDLRALSPLRAARGVDLWNSLRFQHTVAMFWILVFPDGYSQLYLGVRRAHHLLYILCGQSPEPHSARSWQEFSRFIAASRTRSVGGHRRDRKDGVPAGPEPRHGHASVPPGPAHPAFARISFSSYGGVSSAHEHASAFCLLRASIFALS